MRTCLSLAALTLALALIAPAWSQVTIEPKESKVVKTPASLLKTEDDGICTLRWNGFPNNADPAACKFEIRWGLVSDGYTNTAVTCYTGYQIQPLENGSSYMASIRAIDRWGRASAWSAPFSFTGNSARVDAIRNQCCSSPGGFFDDFNVPQGKPDWTHWNFAVNRWTDETINGFFINDQKHAHIMTSSLRLDRSNVVARVRGNMLDLSDNGMRTVFIDMDSSPNLRLTWYMDFIPESSPAWDITNRNSTSLGDKTPFEPPYMLRLAISGGKFAVQLTDAAGSSQWVSLIDLPTFPKIQDKGIANMRRPWKFTISKKLVEAFAMGWDGVYYKVLSTPVNIPWDRARVQNSVFGYNTLKDGFAAWLWHFDNFGFDAPANAAPAETIYDYRTKLTNGLEYGINDYIINIPDAVAGWQQRLFYTLSRKDANQSTFKPGAGNSVVVNGMAFPITLLDDDTQSRMIELPSGLIVQGDNAVTFKVGKTGAMNVHIEAVRPPNDPNPLPPYSTHCQIWGCGPMASFDLGSDVIIEKVGSNFIWQWNWIKPIAVSGVVTVDGSVQQITCITSTGKQAEVNSLELLIDKISSLSVPTHDDVPTISGKYRFYLDTTKLTNGVHELFLRAYTPGGTVSNPDYFDKHSANGSYMPVLINVNN